MSLLLQTTLRMPRLKPRFCSSGGDFQAKRFFVKLSSSRSQKIKLDHSYHSIKFFAGDEPSYIYNIYIYIYICLQQ